MGQYLFVIILFQYVIFSLRALKRDMTLFGKRTGMGIIGDGVTFWQRYINSNFRDSKRQRGINAILGKRSTV